MLKPLLLLLLISGQVALNQWIPLQDSAWVEPPSERAVKWNPRIFEILTFGHLPAAVDWLWLNSMFDTSIAHVIPGTHPKMYYDLDLATDLDPAFYELYFTGGNLLAVIRNDGTGARDIVEKGARYIRENLNTMPDGQRKRYWYQPAYLSMLLGYIYLFELNDMPNASKAFSETGEMPGAPTYMVTLGRRLKDPGGQFEVGLRVIEMMIDGQKEERVRIELEKKRDSLVLGRFLYQLNDGFKAYSRDHGGGKRSLETLWKEYRSSAGAADRDPFGGVLSLDEKGSIVSSTPHEPVFGLE